MMTWSNARLRRAMPATRLERLGHRKRRPAMAKGTTLPKSSRYESIWITGIVKRPHDNSTVSTETQPVRFHEAGTKGVSDDRLVSFRNNKNPCLPAIASHPGPGFGNRHPPPGRNDHRCVLRTAKQPLRIFRTDQFRCGAHAGRFGRAEREQVGQAQGPVAPHRFPKSIHRRMVLSSSYSSAVLGFRPMNIT
jgi:hypothetical protein